MSVTIDEQLRERLGRVVRNAWVRYCKEIGDTKPNHIAPWGELSEQDKEADRQIGVAVWAFAFSYGEGYDDGDGV